MQATEANFLAELERVVRGERPTVDPRALLFVAAEVILEGHKADERDLPRIRSGQTPNTGNAPNTSNAPNTNVIPFPRR